MNGRQRLAFENPLARAFTDDGTDSQRFRRVEPLFDREPNPTLWISSLLTVNG